MYEYSHEADRQLVVDIIQRDGASITLTVDVNRTARTLFDDGRDGTSSDSGAPSSSGSTLTVGGTVFDAIRHGSTLILTDPDSTFDFRGGSTSATLTIVIQRS